LCDDLFAAQPSIRLRTCDIRKHLLRRPEQNKVYKSLVAQPCT
jgi:hypothetical protein